MLPTRCTSLQVHIPPGVHPTRCTSLQVHFPPGVCLPRCTSHQVYIPPGVLPTRCMSPQVYFPPSVHPSKYTSHQVYEPPGVLPTRCMSLQVYFPQGVCPSRCTLVHLGQIMRLLSSPLPGCGGRPVGPLWILQPSILSCVYGWPRTARPQPDGHNKQEIPLESKCSLGCYEEPSGCRALKKPSY